MTIASRLTEAGAKLAGGHKPAWDVVCRMENPLSDLRNYAYALGKIGQGLSNEDDGSAVATLAYAMKDMAERLEEERGKLFELLHADPEAVRRANAGT